jgi:hypothetical protein
VTPWPALAVADVTRATGRGRLRALLAARRALARHAADAHLLVIHDPGLLLVLPALGGPTVWDVHEDTAAAIAGKGWVPGSLRRPLAAAVRTAERIAEHRIHLLLAERDYRQRFRLPTRSHRRRRPGGPPR